MQEISSFEISLEIISKVLRNKFLEYITCILENVFAFTSESEFTFVVLFSYFNDFFFTKLIFCTLVELSGVKGIYK